MQCDRHRTSRSRCGATSRIHCAVSHAQGQLGSTKNSTAVTTRGYDGRGAHSRVQNREPRVRRERVVHADLAAESRLGARPPHDVILSTKHHRMRVRWTPRPRDPGCIHHEILSLVRDLLDAPRRARCVTRHVEDAAGSVSVAEVDFPRVAVVLRPTRGLSGYNPPTTPFSCPPPPRVLTLQKNLNPHGPAGSGRNRKGGLRPTPPPPPLHPPFFGPPPPPNPRLEVGHGPRCQAFSRTKARMPDSDIDTPMPLCRRPDHGSLTLDRSERFQ